MSKENLYLIKLHDDKEQFFKIGTTVHRYCRFYEIMKSGYQIEIIYMVFGIDFYEALQAEKYLHSLFESYTPLKWFGGYRECFSSVNIQRYKIYLNKVVTSHSEITENLKISWR